MARRGQVAWILAVVFVGGVLGWAVSDGPAYAADGPQTLEVDRLIVRHPGGRYRIEIGTRPGSSDFGVFIFDTEKIGRITEVEVPRVKMSVSANLDSAGVMVRGEAPFNSMAGVRVTQYGEPQLVVFERTRGRVRAVLGAGGVSNRTTGKRTHQLPAGTLTLFRDGSSRPWQAPPGQFVQWP